MARPFSSLVLQSLSPQLVFFLLLPSCLFHLPATTYFFPSQKTNVKIYQVSQPHRPHKDNISAWLQKLLNSKIRRVGDTSLKLSLHDPLALTPLPCAVGPHRRQDTGLDL